MTQLLYVNYGIISKVFIFATIIRWNELLLFVCHSFLIESSFFHPLVSLSILKSQRLPDFPSISYCLQNHHQQRQQTEPPFCNKKKHYDSSSNVESPQLKNQTPGKCGSHLRQSNPFAKNPRFLYQTSLQDLSPSLFSLVLISRNNTSLSFPFSLR